jgi:RNA polymerase sigma-70 factor, ECF subfamily
MDATNTEDELFIEFVNSNDEKIFKLIYDKVDWLYRWISHEVMNKEIAEDIFQSTWLKVLQNKKSFNPQRGKLKNWIYTIANNEIKHYWKNRK